MKRAFYHFTLLSASLSHYDGYARPVLSYTVHSSRLIISLYWSSLHQLSLTSSSSNPAHPLLITCSYCCYSYLVHHLHVICYVIVSLVICSCLISSPMYLCPLFSATSSRYLLSCVFRYLFLLHEFSHISLCTLLYLIISSLYVILLGF